MLWFTTNLNVENSIIYASIMFPTEEIIDLKLNSWGRILFNDIDEYFYEIELFEMCISRLLNGTHNYQKNKQVKAHLYIFL